MCLQLVETDLRFEAGERKADEAGSDGDDIMMLGRDALSSIPAVHLTFDIIRCRVHIFSRLVEVWPECVSLLADCQQPMVGIISGVIRFYGCVALAGVGGIMFSGGYGICLGFCPSVTWS